MGYGKDKKGYYFSYYDNAIEGGESEGTNIENNRLYYNPESNLFVDDQAIHGKRAILSEVRATKDNGKASNTGSLIYDGFIDFNSQGGNKW